MPRLPAGLGGEIGRRNGLKIRRSERFMRVRFPPQAPSPSMMLTFTIVTTAPSRWLARIHNRMPVILPDDQIDTWLDPTVSDPQQLGELLKPPPEDFLDCYPVSKGKLGKI